ncbi:MAG: cytochrome c [Thiohalomonadaceae bacterium]
MPQLTSLQPNANSLAPADSSFTASDNLAITNTINLTMAYRLYIVMLSAIISLTTTATAASYDINTQRQQELIHLLRHDCGSCHGMRLKGGLGPALLPENLVDKPAATLEATVLYGRAGTPMAPWRGLLSEEEVSWLIDILQKGVPDAP